MDNLIAEKKAQPMLIVMERGYARKPVSPETAHEWHAWRWSLHVFAPLLFAN